VTGGGGADSLSGGDELCCAPDDDDEDDEDESADGSTDDSDADITSEDSDELADIDDVAFDGFYPRARHSTYSRMEERADYVVQRYTGHRNRRTVKGVNFMGASDEYVVSGSDCGRVFVWEKESGRLLWAQRGDNMVVNCLEPHPHLPLTLATSGIDDDIKIWAPTRPTPQEPPASPTPELGHDSSPHPWMVQFLPGVHSHNEMREEILDVLLNAYGGAVGDGDEEDDEEDSDSDEREGSE